MGKIPLKGGRAGRQAEKAIRIPVAYTSKRAPIPFRNCATLLQARIHAEERGIMPTEFVDFTRRGPFPFVRALISHAVLIILPRFFKVDTAKIHQFMNFLPITRLDT